MKKSIKILSVLFLATTLLASCSDDNDPVDDDIFVGTYKGTVSYVETSSNTNITTDEGRVTLVKVGDTYNFDFSDGIPSLKGIKMEKDQSILISSDGALKIDAGNLVIAFSKDGKVWGADCRR